MDYDDQQTAQNWLIFLAPLSSVTFSAGPNSNGSVERFEAFVKVAT
jgi:hypothetical protein